MGVQAGNESEVEVREEVEEKRSEGEMSVKPEMAFDVCWEVYRGAREVMESKRGIAALNMEMETKYAWRPDVRPKMKDWVADFALAGQAALARDRSGRRGWCLFSFVLFGVGAV